MLIVVIVSIFSMAIKPALHNRTEAKVLWIPPKSLITSVKDITAIIKVELNEIKMMKSGLFYDDTVTL